VKSKLTEQELKKKLTQMHRRAQKAEAWAFRAEKRADCLAGSLRRLLTKAHT